MKHIAITKQFLDGAEVNSVNSRELHKKLQVSTQYSTWIQRTIEKYDFIEKEDYSKMDIINGGNPQVDYIVSIDMAKELAMVSNTEEGKKYRKYLIKIEKQHNKKSNLQLDIQMQRLDALTNVAHATKAKIDNHDERLHSLERNRRLEAWQEKSLQDAKNRKVYELAKDDKNLAKQLHRKVWSLFKKKFHLPRYNELKTGRYEDGLIYLNNLSLADMVA